MAIELKDFLKAGVQFGHEAKRWNPRMQPYIFTKKNGIHIIDLSKTVPMLDTAAEFLVKKAQEGPILFLGSKRQAVEIVTQAAIDCGAYFITNRWAGGLLTNFEQIQKSINKLNDLEKQFSDGVTGRTKYEISLMKKDWERLNRLYGGVKAMKTRPVAIFIVDPGFERGAVRECNYLNIPIAAMVDTNTDPTDIDYPIPSNDDAIGSIKLVVNFIQEKLAKVDSAFKAKHDFKDYTKLDVSIKKVEAAAAKPVEELAPVADVIAEAPAKATKTTGKPEKSAKTKAEAKKAKGAEKPEKTGKHGAEAGTGILGRFQEQKEEQVKKSHSEKK